jgi:hypothetical protein
MEIKRLQHILFIVFIFAFPAFAQQLKKTADNSFPTSTDTLTQAIKSSPAYAEVLLRKTELESMLEEFSVTYTEDFPKVKETRFELGLIQRDMSRMIGVKDANKLTLALGKLMVRRAQLETDLWALPTKFSGTHPDVERAKRRVSIFDKAISEILQ